jgi:hypothetical protein
MRDFRTQFALDKAANGERVELLKRAAVMSPANALRLSIASCLDDDDIVNKRAFIDQQVKDFQAYVAKGGVVTIRKGGATDMDISTQTIIAIAKGVIERGAPPVYEKHVFIKAIAKRADEIRKAGESTQKSFARAITADDLGKLLYSASKAASGPELEPAPVETPAPPAPLGPAHAAMDVLAADKLKANPRMTK